MEKVITLPFATLKNVLFLFLLISVKSIFAQNIQPGEKQTLFQHLNEVNKEWSKQNISLDILEKEISFSTDQFRIQMHLFLVEQILRERIVTKLTPAQISNRNHFLDVLKKYAASGVFPENIYHQNRQPYFVDHLETACAVGHLIQESGATDLAEKIKKENNFAYLAELETEFPAINSWATENGFTTEELAWIQPGYPPAAQSYSEVGNGGGVEGKINVMKTSADGNLLIMAGDFTEVDGILANSIIAWDGENWLTFGEGVEGEVHAIATQAQGKFYIGGNFILNGAEEFSNIAFWNGTSWEGIQKGEMNGTVYTLLSYGGLIAGGDFQNIDNQPIRYLAKLSSGSDPVWNNYARKNIPGTINYEYIDDAFVVDGPVRSLQNIDGHILIGGDFLETAPDISNANVNSISTKNLAYWYNNDWEAGFDNALESVETTLHGSDGKIYTGGSLEYENDLGIFNAGFWEFNMFEQLGYDEGENRVHGFVEHNGTIYGYGDIQPFFSTVWSRGFVAVGGEFGSQWGGLGALFDKSVRAAEVFQEEIYFAGDFTSISFSLTNSDFAGLAKSPFLGETNSVEEGVFEKNKIQIFNVENQLNIRYENLGKNATMNLFNLQGQILKSINLPQGSHELEVELSSWSGGMYVYEVVNENGKQAGKFHVN